MLFAKVDIETESVLVDQAEKEGYRCRGKKVSKDLESVCDSSMVGDECSQLSVVQDTAETSSKTERGRVIWKN